MTVYSPWPWTESLGGIRADDSREYRVQRILFGLVKDRCRELGLREGEKIRCLRHLDDTVVVELSSGEVRKLGLEYSWFVHVELTAAPDPIVLV